MDGSTGHDKEGDIEYTPGHGTRGFRFLGPCTQSGVSKSHEFRYRYRLDRIGVVSPRHSQPEFKPSNIRDSVTGYAELTMKGHNAAWLHAGYNCW